MLVLVRLSLFFWRPYSRKYHFFCRFLKYKKQKKLKQEAMYRKAQSA